MIQDTRILSVYEFAVSQNSFTSILAESKQKTWAIIKQQYVLGSGGMQYNVYAFGGHAILSARWGVFICNTVLSGTYGIR
jgi:hypothetical protein